MVVERVGKRLSLISVVLISAYLVGVHTRATYYFESGLYIPFFIAGVPGLVLLLINSSRIRRRHIQALMAFSGMAAISLFFAPQMTVFFVERIKALAYLTYSLFLAYGLYLELTKWERQALARYFLYATVLILVGCILENLEIIKDISDSFRVRMFPFVYYNDVRDIVDHGGIRPKLFTSEPSWVAGSFVLVSTVWLILSESPKKIAVYLSLLTAMLLVSRSPVLFIGVTNLVAHIGLSERQHMRGSSWLRRKYISRKYIKIVVAAAIGSLLIAIVLVTFLQQRFENVLSGIDGSVTLRLYTPALIALETVRKYPIFGAGIGGKESIEPIMYSVFTSLDINVARIEEGMGVAHTMANAFWEYWTVFGIVGGVMGLVFLNRIAKGVLRKDVVLFYLLILSISLTTGAVGGLWIWSAVFLYLVAIQKAKGNQT